VAKKGGALPAFEELELIRAEGGVPVRRFLARLGIPRSTWYWWRAQSLHGRTVRRWPAPVVERVAPQAAETAHRYAAWGHRKIWAMLRADGVRVSASSVERALRRQSLLQPRRYLAERRALAAHRKAVFLAPPARRNRVWQVDFTEFETSRGGTWRILPVVDYATKLCLAAAVTGTSTAHDAIESLEIALVEAERLVGHPLLDECLDPATGELTPLVIVTDNGPAFKSADFLRFIARHPELRHVRTRHHAPETNGVVERFNRSLEYEHLYREEIPDVLALDEQVRAFVTLYNWVRPHETLGLVAPIVRYLADPADGHEPGPESNLSDPESVQDS
jgi:transposase InsO family protein